MQNLHKKYPWNEWFSKKFFFLIKGRDYTCSTKSIVQQVRNRAAENWIGVSIRKEIHEGTEIVLVIKRSLAQED
jgi:hypothetical protein